MSLRLFVKAGSGTIRAQAIRRKWYLGDTERSSRIVWETSGPCEDQKDLPRAFAELLKDPGLPRGVRRVRVMVGPPMMQVRILEALPPVRTAQLQRLVQLQASRFFRQDGVPLVTAARWVTRKGDERMAVAAALPADVATSLSQTADASDLVLDAIESEEVPGASGLSVRLIQSGAARKRPRVSTRSLALAAVSMWLVLGGLYTARVSGYRRSMERERAALREPVAAVRAAQREMANALAMVNAVNVDRAAEARTLLLLAAVTRALPDSSHITSLALDSARVVVTGYAKRASEVAAAFGREGAFIEPSLDGQVTKELMNGVRQDRFTLSFEIGS